MRVEGKVNKPTPTVEDYLASIYTLERDRESVIGARLAELLGVSAPTVTVTLRRMIDNGWVTMDGRKEIHLTPSGTQAAADVVSRHMLTEWMLANVLRIPWSDLHSEAHAIEHTISAKIEASMRAQFSDPQVCPHGNPLPGHEGVSEGWVRLLDAPLGRRVIIRRVHEHAEDRPEILKFLEANGILPGVEACVGNVLAFNQTIDLEIGGSTHTLGLQVAGFLYVEILADEES